MPLYKLAIVYRNPNRTLRPFVAPDRDRWKVTGRKPYVNPIRILAGFGIPAIQDMSMAQAQMMYDYATGNFE